VLGDLWKRPGLSARDRSIVTIAALIARDQTVELPYYLNLALDNGVKPAEISEIITHLAFYTGWANAMNAVLASKDVFKNRNIGADQLSPASGAQLPLDEASEAQRASRVGQQFGQITPSLVHYTTDVLFRDLWLRPGLAPRDRGLVTVSALVATGQVAQITYHLNRAMDNGLSKEEAGRRQRWSRKSSRSGRDRNCTHADKYGRHRRVCCVPGNERQGGKLERATKEHFYGH
jgi:4-carboxymuconolactone decarboxylase